MADKLAGAAPQQKFVCGIVKGLPLAMTNRKTDSHVTLVSLAKLNDSSKPMRGPAVDKLGVAKFATLWLTHYGPEHNPLRWAVQTAQAELDAPAETVVVKATVFKQYINPAGWNAINETPKTVIKTRNKSFEGENYGFAACWESCGRL